MERELKKIHINTILIKSQILTIRSFTAFMHDRITIEKSRHYDTMIRKAATDMILNLD